MLLVRMQNRSWTLHHFLDDTVDRGIARELFLYQYEAIVTDSALIALFKCLESCISLSVTIMQLQELNQTSRTKAELSLLKPVTWTSGFALRCPIAPYTR